MCSWYFCLYLDNYIKYTIHLGIYYKSADLKWLEIGRSKQCLEKHGSIHIFIFAYPNGRGSDNSKVVNTDSKYYH